MRNVVRLTLGLVVFALAATVAQAATLTWYLNGVKFGDGGTATGSFNFDPDAGTPCSTGNTPCGRFSDVNITTSGGLRPGNTYRFVCGQDVPTCTGGGTLPDSTQVLTLTTQASDQTGMPEFALFFTGIGGLPPMGLTDFGGTIDVSNNSGNVGAGAEGTCLDAPCSAPVAGSVRSTVDGTVASSGSIFGGEFGYFFFN